MKPAPQLDSQPFNANISIVDRAYITLKGQLWMRTSTAIEKEFVSTSVS